MISKAKYRFTPEAQEDLINIHQYTSIQWGKDQSKKYLSEMRQTIKALSVTPEIGKQREEIGINIFSFPHASHVIYYTLCNQQMVIFAVLHKRMVPFSHLHNRNTI